MKKQAILFGLLGASVVALGIAHRKNKAILPAAEQISLSLLGQAGGRLIRSIALRSLGTIGTVWAIERLCEKAIPESAE